MKDTSDPAHPHNFTISFYFDTKKEEIKQIFKGINFKKYIYL